MIADDSRRSANPLTPLSKRERERLAFDAVYSAERWSSVVHQDRPDFVVRWSASSAPFGVEITELYETEADARLIQHPSYFQELLDGRRLMSRDDAKTLGVATATITDKHGNIKYETLQVLLREQVSPLAHSEALAAVVEGKNRKADGYGLGLSHLNLIVFDCFRSPSSPGDQYETATLIGDRLRTALNDSPFDEVFLVERQRDGRLRYRPLQLLLLLEAFQLFQGAVATYEHADEIEPEALEAYFTATTDLPNVVLGTSWDGRGDAAYYRQTGIRRHGDSTNILDGHDHNQPRPPPSGPVVGSSSSEVTILREHVRDFRSRNCFTCSLWIEAGS